MSDVIQGSVVKNLGISVDNEIPRFDLTTGKRIKTGSDVTISDSFVISRATTNANLILDGNGTGVVQHNTSTSSYQMPKSRAPTGLPGIYVLGCAPSTGDCDWYNISALLVNYWQTIYDGSASFSTESFVVNDTYKGLRIKDAATPISGVMFAVRNNAESTEYLYVDSTKVYTEGYLEAGNYGTESAGVNIGGTTYALGLRVNDIGGTRQGQIMMHRHSTSYGSMLIGSRSNSDTSAHADVTNSQTIMGLVGTGWTSASYKQFGIIQIEVDATGTVSATSAPGRIAFYTSANSSIAPSLRAYVDSAGTFGFGTGTISSAGVGSAFTQWNVDNLRLDGNTLSSTSGALILDAAATAIQMSDAVEMSTNALKFSASNQASIFWDTGLVVNPDPTSNLLTIGTATGTGSANMVLNKIAVGNSTTGNATTIAYINGVITGSGRGILNFVLTFTGAGTSATVSLAGLTDRGTNANIIGVGYQAQVQLDGSSHSTSATHYGFYAQMGLTTNFTASGGTWTTYGTRLTISAFGVGGSHTGGTFRRYAIYQDAITAIGGTPSSDLIMGAYFENSINLIADNKLIFDSTSTTLGDSYIDYNSTNTNLEVYVDNTKSWTFDTTVNSSQVPLGVLAGTSTTYAKVGGTIEVNTTAAGTPASTTETDLQTYSIPANSMGTNGDSVYFEMSFTTAANANTKRLKIKYGATTMYDSTALALNNSVITVRGRIIRTGAATQNYYIEVHSSSALLVATSAQGTAAETLSGAVTLKATGQNGTATANDLVETNSHIQFSPNK